MNTASSKSNFQVIKSLPNKDTGHCLRDAYKFHYITTMMAICLQTKSRTKFWDKWNYLNFVEKCFIFLVIRLNKYYLKLSRNSNSFIYINYEVHNLCCPPPPPGKVSKIFVIRYIFIKLERDYDQESVYHSQVINAL